MRCDACPVLCRIRPGRAGACARYANENGQLVRTDPVVLMQRTLDEGGKLVAVRRAPNGTARRSIRRARSSPASAPAPPIPTTSPRPSSSRPSTTGVDTVTVVTEGIFSYCGVKVKIDTDRHLGPETGAGSRQRRAGRPRHDRRIRLADALHRRRAAPDRRLQEGRQRHLRRAARSVLRQARWRWRSTAAMRWSCRPARRRSSTAEPEVRMRVGCGSATVGIFAQAMARPRRRGDRRRRPHHRRADRAPGRPRAGYAARRHPRARAQIDAGALFPGRQSRPRLGRHRHHRSAVDHPEDRPQGGLARPASADDLDHRRGRALLRARRPAHAACRPRCPHPCAPSSSASARTASRRCARVLFMAGAGGSLRAGVTENPGAADALRGARRDARDHGRRAGATYGRAAASR